MKIHWFPGHMTKAMRMMEEELKLVDIVVFVLDSRAPKSSLNPAAEKLIEGKPVLYVLNKADLSDSEALKAWQVHFAADGKTVVTFDATKSGGGKIITEKLKLLAKPKIEKYAEKGVTATVRAMVLGVPNSGKSTIINNIAGQSRAITGNKPGVTRGKQWLKVDQNVELLDTPGVLPPNFEDQNSAKNLAYIGSIKDEVVDTTELAAELLFDLKRLYPALLAARYKTDNFEDICRSRGCIMRGGEIDFERGAKLIIDDFRKGRIGKVCMDK